MIEAVGTKLVIQKIEREQKTAGGIFITNQQDPQPLAVVLSRGDDVTIKVAVGDKIAVLWASTAQQPYKGKTYHIVDQTGVVAVERSND
jgi:co-chaperonin GroES (HSP10)